MTIIKEMHTSPNELRSKILRYLSYVLIVVFVAGGTFYLASYAQGVLINPRTGEVVETGLAIIQTKPLNANVTINGEKIENETPARQVLPIGSYSIQLDADKYRTWEKSFAVGPADLVWLDYPLLIPQEVNTTQEIELNEQPTIATSNNRRWLLMSQADFSFKLSEIDQDEISSEDIVLPDNITSGISDKATVESLTFSSNDRYALAEYTTKETSQFVRIDRQNPDESLLLGSELDENFETVVFDKARNVNNLYGLRSGKLYRVDLSSRETTEIAENVAAFDSYKDYVFVVEKPSRKNKARAYYLKDDQTKNIGKLTGSKAYKIEASDFDGKVNVALSNNVAAQVFTDVTRAPKISKSKTKANNIEFTSNGRFLKMTDGKTIEISDLENNRQFVFRFSAKATGIAWLDNFRLVGVTDEQVQIVDFDGNNKQKITAANDQTVPISNRDNESIFSIDKVKDRYVLQRSGLRVE